MESVAQFLSSEGQNDLIREYCREAEALIREAGSLSEARKIKKEQCGRFEQNCSSVLVANAVEKYLDDVISSRWEIHGTHRSDNAD